jgi:hypothetical protein
MRRSVLAFSLFAFCLPGGAGAQPRTPAPGARAPAAAAEPFSAPNVVAEVRRIIAERYVLPERRPALDAVLAEGLASGRYNVASAGDLAERINADLERVGHDRHLNFRYAPQPAGAGPGPGPRRGPPDEAAQEREAAQRNFGIRELRVLPGNLRYMAYDGFEWTGESSARALETAMRFLSGGDAVIIDLRRNGGGSPEAVQYLVSHFMPANRPLMTFYMNGSTAADTTATLADVPAGRMIGKPLYVLTSGGTASAAEEFSGHVAGYRLGELVGENTAGAGFRNDMVRIDGGFLLSVSVGRAVLAATGKDWEAVGHAPSIAAPVTAALDVAQTHALRRLVTTAPAQDRPRLEALADGIAARQEARATAMPLTAYAGNYGERVVSVDGNALYYQRGARARERLIALGGNVFTFENDPMIRLDFAAANGSAAAMEVGSPGLPPQGRYERTR